MIKMDDICFVIGDKLEDKGFFNYDIETQKAMFDMELNDYLLEKIDELDSNNCHYFKNVNEVVNIMGKMIPKEEHGNTLKYLIFVIMMVVTGIQRKEMSWKGSVDPNSIGIPTVEFDEQGNWIKLNTHEQDSYVDTFNVAYNVFKNEFKPTVGLFVPK